MIRKMTYFPHISGSVSQEFDMASFLLIVICLIFISCGLPDSLLGSGWPQMQLSFHVPSSYSGYVSRAISFMTIIASLSSPMLIKKFKTKWIVVVSIFLSVLGLYGFSLSTRFWMLLVIAIPYGLGAGAIDASINHFVANHYSGSAMDFIHCFYGVGAALSPHIMALAISMVRWNEGYLWTAYVQTAILIIVIISLPLWKSAQNVSEEKEITESASLWETIRHPGVILTLLAFFAYAAGESVCFLWTPSFFDKNGHVLPPALVASFGSLIFGGLALGRFLSGFITDKLGDRKIIKLGVLVEIVGIILILIPGVHYMVAVVGFVVIGVGMGPIFPTFQHMAPVNFGKKYSAAVIGLQMSAAYVGTTFMPLAFGILQQHAGIGIMPLYLFVFAVLNIVLLQLALRKVDKNQSR